MIPRQKTSWYFPLMEECLREVIIWETRNLEFSEDDSDKRRRRDKILERQSEKFDWNSSLRMFKWGDFISKNWLTCKNYSIDGCQGQWLEIRPRKTRLNQRIAKTRKSQIGSRGNNTFALNTQRK